MLATRSAARSLLASSSRFGAKRFSSQLATKSLMDKMEEMVPKKRQQLATIKKELGDKKLGDVKVDNIIGGMRGLKAMLWEASVLDPNDGIRFHDVPLLDLLPKLPEPITESMLYYLLTGSIPSEAEAKDLSKSLVAASTLSPEVEKVMDNLPKGIHPMTQLGIGIHVLEKESKFTKEYMTGGLKKAEYWRTTLEDSLDLIAKLPTLASRVFRNTYFPDQEPRAIDKNDDLIGNYSKALGFEGKSFEDYMKIYITLHTDHEGGNVSAHATHLVGSALSNAYQSYSAGLAGLAGPLHGLANQEVLRFILTLQKDIGGTPSDEKVTEWLWSWLKSGQVIPGYGHAVLRQTDPRYTALQDFITERPDEFEGSEVVGLVRTLKRIAPGVLTEHGKTKNPNPNVDATSGCLLFHYGMTQFEYYTVIFAVSRAIGALTQLVWDRALGLSIERPKSLSLDELEKQARAAK